MNQVWLKIRMFFNNLSPLHIVYAKDASGNYMIDGKGNPIPERYDPPTIVTHWKCFLVLALIIFAVWQLIKLVIITKIQRT